MSPITSPDKNTEAAPENGGDPKPRRRGLRPSIFIAGGLAIAATAWIVSGNLPQEAPTGDEAAIASDVPEEAMEEESTQPQTAVAVRVIESVAQLRQSSLRVVGRTEANRTGRLMSETEGRIVELMADEGASVETDGLIARLDVNERVAMVRKAEALVKQRRIEFEAATKLAERGFQSEVRRAEADAQLQSAEAELRLYRIDLAKTQLVAPFDGVIMHRTVELGDYVGRGDPIAEIVDLDPIIITAEVSEQEVGRIVPGGLAMTRLITGETLEGVVSYIAPQADDATRTFTIEIEAPNPDLSVKAGVTTEVLLPTTNRKAHLISPALLTLDDSGAVGVKYVDARSIARFAPIQIVEDSPEGLWIVGLPDQATLISIGHDYAVEGQRVLATPDTTLAARPSATQ